MFFCQIAAAEAGRRGGLMADVARGAAAVMWGGAGSGAGRERWAAVWGAGRRAAMVWGGGWRCGVVSDGLFLGGVVLRRDGGVWQAVWGAGRGADGDLFLGGVGWRMVSGVWGEYGKALAGQATAGVACRLNGWNVMLERCEMCGAEQCATAERGEYGKALAGQATASVACRLNGWNVM